MDPPVRGRALMRVRVRYAHGNFPFLLLLLFCRLMVYRMVLHGSREILSTPLEKILGTPLAPSKGKNNYSWGQFPWFRPIRALIKNNVK